MATRRCPRTRRSAWAEHSFLLESVVGGTTWAAYSFVGIAPRAVVRWKAGTATVTWYDVDAGGPPRTASWATPDPTAALAEVLGELRPVAVPGLPRFWGGAVGWIAYDCVRAFEELPARARPGLDLPGLCMVVTDTLVIFDNLRQTLKVVAHAVRLAPRARRGGVRARVRADRRDRLGPARAAPARSPQLEPPRPRRWQAAAPVPRVVVHQGRLLQRRSTASRTTSSPATRSRSCCRSGSRSPPTGARPLDVYRALRVINPSPYMFHLEFPDARVTGASPETLVRLSDGRVELRPIAGTRPRGASGRRGRSARGRAARRSEGARRAPDADRPRPQRRRPGRPPSARSSVSEQMVIERYSHVMHLTSHVVGTLAPGKTLARRAARRVPRGDACRARRRSAPWRSSTSSSRTSAASTAGRSAT